MTEPDPLLKVLPDKVRSIELRLARCEDRLDDVTQKRSTYVPSRRFAMLSGRDREVVFLIVLCVTAEVVSWLVRRGLDKVPAAPLAPC